MASYGLIVGIILVVLVIGGFFLMGGEDSSTNSQNTPSDNLSSSGGGANEPVPSENPPQVPEDNAPSASPDWIDFQLTDINSGDPFTISELNDKPILMESFAVWCPKCTSQQNNIKELHEEIGEDVVSVSLNTDAGEDEAEILAHTQQFGFDWRYAIAPSELTQSLIDEFGLNIINAPSVPVVLICPGGNFRQLDSGIKTVAELKEAIATC